MSEKGTDSVDQKSENHPVCIRWTHWINFPVLTIMIWSGAMIYWANDIYWPHISERVWGTLKLDHSLADGMAWHFFFMWIFAINGFVYVAYVLLSGEWRYLAPTKHTFREAIDVVLHDLHLLKRPLPVAKFNAAQRIAYTSITVMGFGSLITGLAIYKPIQISWLTRVLGGYETVRLEHYLLTVGYIAFFFVHVGQVVRAGWNNFRAMVGRRLGFAVLFLGFVAGALAFMAIKHAPTDNEIPGPLRKMEDFNAALWGKILSPSRLDTSVRAVPAGRKARFNGDVGLDEENFEPSNWKLQVVNPVGGGSGAMPAALEITLDDLKKLPRVEIFDKFKCIEGWSEDMQFAGVRFIDFLEHYHLGTHSGSRPDFAGHRDDLFGYVGMSTPDDAYYVSIDMKSMLSPQTLLAYEQNGQPLTLPHGAPLRLVIPNKYGVKNLKRIGKIVFSDTRLPDYWGEQGYDWFIGL